MAKNPRLQVSQPIVEEDGTMSDPFLHFILLLNSLVVPIFGAGSPEGVIEAPQFSPYIDTTAASAGTTGSIRYIKGLEDIGGDKTLGWFLE